MAVLTKDQILSAQDLKSEDVQVDEWGGSVRVRVLTGGERDAFATSLLDKDGRPDGNGLKVKLLARCLIDESGARLFTDDELQLLAGKSAPALDRLFQVAERLNKLGSEAVDQAEKN